MPSPVIRIAPNPSRFTSRPAILIVPAGITEPYNASLRRGEARWMPTSPVQTNTDRGAT
jgi:hypothetical protein